MRVQVEVQTDPHEAAAPPDGLTVRVDLLDVSLADAASRVVASAATPLRGSGATVELEVDESALAPGAHLQLAAHAAEDPNRGRARGDWITTAAFPWRPGETSSTVVLRPIG